MRYLLLLGLLSGPAFSSNLCEKNPIYCSILRIKPNANKPEMMRLSNYIAKYSKKYQTDPYRSVAIAAQESMFRNVKSKTNDIGIFQLNRETLLMYGKDPTKVAVDLEYATYTHIWILSRKKEYCKDTKYPWACYHSSTPRYYNKYVKMVNRYYNLIKETKK